MTEPNNFEEPAWAKNLHEADKNSGSWSSGSTGDEKGASARTRALPQTFSEAKREATSEAYFFLKDFSGGGREARATGTRTALHEEERIVVYDSHIMRDPQGAPQGGVFASFRHVTIVPANKRLDVMKLRERYIIIMRNLHEIGPTKGFFPLSVAFPIGSMATIDLALLHHGRKACKSY